MVAILLPDDEANYERGESFPCLASHDQPGHWELDSNFTLIYGTLSSSFIVVRVNNTTIYSSGEIAWVSDDYTERVYVHINFVAKVPSYGCDSSCDKRKRKCNTGNCDEATGQWVTTEHSGAICNIGQTRSLSASEYGGYRQQACSPPGDDSGAPGGGQAFGTSALPGRPQNCCCDKPHDYGYSVEMDAVGELTLRTPPIYVKVLGGTLDLTSYRVNGTGESPGGSGIPVGKGGTDGARNGSFKNIKGSLGVPRVGDGKGAQSTFKFRDGVSEKHYDAQAQSPNKLTSFDDGARWTETGGDSTEYNYDDAWQIQNRKYLNGGCIYYEYDAGHRVTRITGDVPGEIYFDYGSTNLKRIVHRDLSGPDFKEWYFYYDGDNLSEFVGPEGCSYLYEYDDGRIIKEVDSENYTEYFFYDDFGGPGIRLSEALYPSPTPSAVEFEFYDGAFESDPAKSRAYKKTIVTPYLEVYYEYDAAFPAISSAKAQPQEGGTAPDLCAPDLGYHPPDLAGNLAPLQMPPGVMQAGSGGSLTLNPANHKGGSNTIMTLGPCSQACLPPERKYEKGNLTEATDGSGRKTYVGYDDDHNQIAILDVFGNSSYFAFDEHHRMIRSVSKRWPESSAEDFTSYYNYDEMGNMYQFRNPLGNISLAHFERGGVAIARGDQNDHWTYYQYDSVGRMTDVTDPEGGSAEFTYNIFSDMLRQVSPRGFETTYAYDAHSRVKRILPPDNGVTYYEYGGRCTEGPRLTAHLVQGVWRTSSAKYDGLSRMDRFQDAAGGATYYSYAGFYDAVTSLTDPRGNETSFTYDGVLRLLSKVDALGNTTLYQYGLLQMAEVSPRWVEGTTTDEFTTYYFYDGEKPIGAKFVKPRQSSPWQVTDTNVERPDWRLREKRDPLGNSTLYDYDANGNIIERESPRGTIWGYAYDRIDRLTTATNPMDGEIVYSYDPVGNITSVQNERGISVAYGYDQNNRLISEEDVQGGVTRHAFDPGNNRIRLQDARDNTSYYTYDKMNRRISLRDPVGGVSLAAYNEAGDLIRSVSPRWPEIDVQSFSSYFVYDAMSRQVASRDALGFTTYFGYDLGGNFLRRLDPRWTGTPSTDSAITTYYHYDRINRVVSAFEPVARATPAVPYYHYDAADNRIAKVSPRWPEDSAAAFTTYYKYDPVNQQIAIRNPLGFSTYFGYDQNGNLARTVSPRWAEATASAFTTYYTYDALDRQVSVRTPLGNTSYTGYDPLGDVLRTVNPRWVESTAADFTTYFGYDLLNRRVYKRNAQGEGTYFGYDAAANLVRLKDHIDGASSANTYYGYDGNDRLVRSKDALDRNTYYVYDLGGNLIRNLFPGDLSPTTYFAYDANNQMVRRKTPAGSAYFAYDAAGAMTAAVSPRWVESSAAAFTTYFVPDDNPSNMRQVTDPLGGVRKNFYNAENQVSIFVDERNNSTYFIYDAVGRLSGVKNALGEQTNRTFDGAGNITNVQPPVGNSSQFAYDNDNQLQRAQNGAGVTAYFASDANGNRIRSMLVSAGHTTYFSYDRVNRLSRVKDALGNDSYFAYDVGGNLSRAMDPLQHTTYFGYDLLDRISRVKDPLQNTSYFGYDLAGNRCREQDANVHTVYYQYDAANRVSAIKDALGISSYYVYDTASNLVRQVDNNQQAMYFSYDALNRKVSQVLGVGGYGTQAYGITPYGGSGITQQFAYDATSNLSRTLDQWGASYFVYDVLNRISRRVDPAAHSMYYAYDAVSDLIRLKYPDAGAVAYYGYDDGNRMSRANCKTADTSTDTTCYYVYDTFGNIDRKCFFNNVTCYYAYDDAQRVARMDYEYNGATQVGLFEFARDAAGRIIRLGRENNTAVYYGYDDADRLLNETWRKRSDSSQVYAFSYDYDPVGNRMRMRREGASAEVSSAYYAYADDNSLIRRKVTTPAPTTLSTYYTYDPNGALIKEWDMETPAATYYVYGPQGLITTIIPPSGTTDQWTCDYDARLNRYKSKNGTAAEKYNIFEGLKLLEERNTSGDAVTARNVHGVSTVPDIGTLVEVNVDIAGIQQHAPIMDHRGTIYKLTNASGGVAYARQYDAFGVILSADAGWPTDLGYQTNWKMLKIGSKTLCISGSRVYDPDIGRFVRSDPVSTAMKVCKAGGNAIGIYAGTRLAVPVLTSLFLGALNNADYSKWFLNTYRAWSCDPVGEVDVFGMQTTTANPNGIDSLLDAIRRTVSTVESDLSEMARTARSILGSIGGTLGPIQASTTWGRDATFSAFIDAPLNEAVEKGIIDQEAANNIHDAAVAASANKSWQQIQQLLSDPALKKVVEEEIKKSKARAAAEAAKAKARADAAAKAAKKKAEDDACRCPDDVRKKLHDAVDKECKPPGKLMSCRDGFTPFFPGDNRFPWSNPRPPVEPRELSYEEIAEIIGRNLSCIHAREEMQNKCWSKDAPGWWTHVGEIETAIERIANCESLLNPRIL